MHKNYEKNNSLIIPSDPIGQLNMLFKKWYELVLEAKTLWNEKKIEHSYKKIQKIIDGLFMLISLLNSNKWIAYITSTINNLNSFLLNSDLEVLDKVEKSFDHITNTKLD